MFKERMKNVKLVRATVCFLLAALLLASFHQTPSGEMHAAQNIRQTQGRKEVTCCLLLKDVQYNNTPTGPEESWECELEDVMGVRQSAGHMKKLVGLSEEWIGQHRKEMVSGEAHLTIPEAECDGDEVRIPPGQKISVERRQKKTRQGGTDGKEPQGKGPSEKNSTNGKPSSNRRLEGVSGRREVLVVRVKAKDSVTSGTIGSVRDSFFGTNKGDAVNMRSQFLSCSHGKLDFVPTPHRNGGNGVIEVDVDEIAQGTPESTIRDAAIDAVTEMVGDIPSQFDHVILCLPPGTSGGWVAYAFINHWMAVFNDAKCTYPSYQMHEVGHNLGLAHSGLGTNSYGDRSGMMGYSYSEDEGPKMCFNGAKSWQLGWYSDRHVTVDPQTSEWRGKLIGFVDYPSSSDEFAVIAMIEAGEYNYYLAFNRQSGSNEGTVDGANRVLVTRKASGYASSLCVANLAKGGDYTIDNFKNTGDVTIVTVTSINIGASPGYAEVSVVHRAAPTISPAPTPAPFACAGESRFECVVTTDEYPSENTWALTQDGRIIEEGHFSEKLTTHVAERCLPPGNYVFSIYDQFSDGMCCTYGQGKYMIALDGNEIATGGEFGAEASHEIVVRRDTDAPTSSPTVAPTSSPTVAPTKSPTVAPTSSPTATPTASPTTRRPTVSPTISLTTPQPTPRPTTKSDVIERGFFPLDDAYVWSGTKETNNYGTWTTLMLKKDSNERRVVLKFDLGQEDFSKESNAGATLRLHVASTGADEFRNVRATRLADTNNFDETSVTWANLVPIVEQEGADVVSVGSSNVGSWIEMDVTDLVLTSRFSPMVVLMLEIVSSGSSGNKCVFSSREVEGFEPELVLGPLGEVNSSTSYSFRLKPSSDAEIRNKRKENKNFGLINFFSARNARTMRKDLLRFNLGDVVPSDSARALLLLHVSQVDRDPSRLVTVSRLAADDSGTSWEEATVTWANADPVVAQTGTTFEVTAADVHQWMEVDVSDLVAGSGGGTLDLMLHVTSGRSGKSTCAFSSREVTELSPELLIEP